MHCAFSSKWENQGPWPHENYILVETCTVREGTNTYNGISGNQTLLKNSKARNEDDEWQVDFREGGKRCFSEEVMFVPRNEQSEWMSHQTVLGERVTDGGNHRPPPGLWCGNGVSVSSTAYGMEQGKTEYGRWVQRRRQTVRSWRQRWSIWMYPTCDTKSLEFYEKSSNIQCMWILTKFTLAGVCKIDCETRLEAGRPVRICHRST